MDFDIIKIRNSVKMKSIPFLFERYEIFIVLIGMVIVFLIAGFVFYEKAYKTTATILNVEIEVARVKSELFEKTIKELEQKKEIAPDLLIIDPFR